MVNTAGEKNMMESISWSGDKTGIYQRNEMSGFISEQHVTIPTGDIDIFPYTRLLSVSYLAEKFMSSRPIFLFHVLLVFPQKQIFNLSKAIILLNVHLCLGII